jgi:hypothetical protein
MTVPMSFDRPNVIVGADLADFLGVGIRVGFFFLEQLVYQRARFFEAYAGRGEPYVLDPSQRTLLDRIGREFDVEPPKDLDAHLDDLEARFGAWLEPPSPTEGSERHASIATFLELMKTQPRNKPN